MAREASTAEPAPTGGGGLRSPALLAQAAAFLALYLLSFWWATNVGVGGPVLVWYPPAALAVAATTLYGWRAAPLLVVAEILTTSWLSGYGSDFGPGGVVLNALVLAAAYTAAGEAFRYLRADASLHALRDLVCFLVAGVLVAPALAAPAGVGVQVLLDLVPRSDAASQAGIFWIGDAVAIVALTPMLLLLFADSHTTPRQRWLPLGGRPGTLALELLIPAALVVALFATTDSPLRFGYFALLPTAGVALRWGLPGAALSGAATVSVAVAAAHGDLPNALDRSELQLLLGTIALSGLVLGAIETSRRVARAAQQQLSDVVESSPDLIATLSPEGEVLYLNPAGRTLLGAETLSLDEVTRRLGSQCLGDGFALATAAEVGAWTGEHQLTTLDGRVLDLSQVLIAHRNRSGELVRLSTVCRDLTDRRQLEERLSRQAFYDEATGLANRALFVEQLERELLEQGDEPSAVLLVDLARFAITNETFGFHVGDLVLQGVAKRLSEAVSPHLVARYGGDVFAIVHPRLASEVQVTTTAARLLEAVAAPFTINGRRLPVSARIGVVLTTDPRLHAADYLRNAEAALHRAKRSSAGIAVFDPGMDRRAHELLELEIDLRTAIADGSWHLAYQPVLDLTDGRVVGCEALLRWDHPQRGPISPLQIVDIAETTGLIHTLGEAVLRRACAQAATWAAAGIDLSVAVNASAHQLDSDDFAATVQSAIRDVGHDPARIVVEITESALAARSDELDVVERVRAGGCKIALDDFGTGYSSLARLRELPIDVLKIDRAFVTPLGESPSANATIEAIVAVGHALGLSIVAEGVETEHQADALRALGCDRAQGFLWAKPMPPDAFEAWLASR